MNIYDFIHSKDVRKYLQEIRYQFTTAEAAFVVYWCKHVTLSQKIAAWQEIIETMPDCSMKSRINMVQSDSFHAFLKDYIALQKRDIQDFYACEGYIYGYELLDKYGWNGDERVDFPTPFRRGDILASYAMDERNINDPFVLSCISDMPGVKKLFQESENSAKPEYIHGDMFGGLGIPAGSVRNRACIPLSIRLHDGLQTTREWKGASVSGASHVVQMVEDAYRAAHAFGDCLLLPDRYFLTVPALEKLKSLNSGGDVHMEIVTKAKKSCTAFEKPGPRKPGRGWPPKKGVAVHLKELFLSHKEQFQEVEVELDPLYELSYNGSNALSGN